MILIQKKYFWLPLLFERGLAISAPESTIILFTPQFAQPGTNPQFTLNNSILPLFYFRFVNWEWYSTLTSNSMPISNIWSPGLYPVSTSWRLLLVPTAISERKPYLSLVSPLYGPFSCMQSRLVSQRLIILYSKTPNYPKLCPPHSHRLR